MDPITEENMPENSFCGHEDMPEEKGPKRPFNLVIATILCIGLAINQILDCYFNYLTLRILEQQHTRLSHIEDRLKTSLWYTKDGKTYSLYRIHHDPELGNNLDP